LQRQRVIITAGVFVLILAAALAAPFLIGGEQGIGTLMARRDPTARPTIPGVREAVAVTPQSTQAPVCTHPPEYWIERPQTWPEQVSLGEVIYSRAEMQELFRSQDDLPASVLLRSMYITLLNALNGADITSVSQVLEEANQWLVASPPGTRLSDFNRRRGLELSALLESYNRGDFGPGQCPGSPAAGEASRLPENTPTASLGSGSIPQTGPATAPALPAGTSTPMPPSAAAPPAATAPPPAAPTSPPPALPTLTLPAPTPTLPGPAPASPTPALPTITLSPLPTATLAPSPLPPSPTATLAPPSPTVEPTSPPPATATTAPSAGTGANGLCTGTIGKITINQNLQVPAGASCTLNGTYVTGNLTVASGAVLSASSISVDGNLQAKNASRVEVSGGSVGGNIQVENGGMVSIYAVRVDGSLQVFGNTGGVTISDNSIGGNLQCKDNSPAPGGGGNLVQGNAEDQCENLR
jgi:hypothetical protein